MLNNHIIALRLSGGICKLEIWMVRQQEGLVLLEHEPGLLDDHDHELNHFDDLDNNHTDGDTDEHNADNYDVSSNDDHAAGADDVDLRPRAMAQHVDHAALRLRQRARPRACCVVSHAEGLVLRE